MVEEVSKGEKKKFSGKKCLNYCRKNPWVISTIALGIVVLVLMFTSFGCTGKVISEEEASSVFLSYVQEGGANLDSLEVTSVKLENGIYKIFFKYEGKEYPVAFSVTPDGKMIGQMTEIVPSGISSPSPSTSEPVEVPKSDKPQVSLYVWSYCPYGVLAQGPLSEVASLLKDDVSFEIVPYYAGHGEYELQQNEIQSCIQKIYPEKYWSYASEFVEKVYPVCSSSRSVDCDKNESIKIMNSLGIDSNRIFNCVETEGNALFEAASQKASENGVSGSPTVTINGVKANVARNAQAYKNAICGSFNNAPSECDQELSGDSAAASGSC